MCRLLDLKCCVYDSSQKSTFALKRSKRSKRSKKKKCEGSIFCITVQSGEQLWAYNLEKYFGNESQKRPDHLLVGRVGEGPWVVVLIESKSQTGWSQALNQFEEVLPALGKGGEKGGEEHHRECARFFPLGRDHRVFAVVVGQVGSEYRKFISEDRKRVEKLIQPWGGKEIVVVPPLWGKCFRSLREFWVYLGILGKGEA